MNLNEMVYLLVIGKLGGHCSLYDVWNELAALQGQLPEFKLIQRNFYSIIQKLEARKLIASTQDRSDVHNFPAKAISITPAGLKYVESYSKTLPVLIPASPEGESPSKGRRKIELEQDDLADLTQSIIAEISNNLFDVESIDEKLRAKIEKSAGRIIGKVQKYV